MNAALLGMLLTLFMASASIIFAVVKNIIDKINQNQSTIPTTIPSENMTIIETTTLETDQISVSTTTSSTIPTQISSTILSTIPITTSSTIPATTQISSTILTTTQLTTSNTIPTIIPSTILSTTPKTNVETVPKTNVQEISTTILTTTTPLPTIIQTTIEYSTIYYPACDNSYSSLVDALKSIGEDSSFSNRKLIAEINGISNYSGTAEENIELLNKLKNGKLIKSISSTIITVPTLDTSNPATPSTTIPLTDESITIPISDTDNIKETDAITDDNEIEDKLIYFSKCDSKYNSIEEALKSIYAFSSYEYRVQIGKVNNIPTDDSAKLNMELLKRLKNGNLIRPSLIVPPFQEIYNKEQIDDMIKKLEESKNTNIQKRKKP